MKKYLRKTLIIIMFLFLSFSLCATTVFGFTFDFNQFEGLADDTLSQKIQGPGATIISIFQVFAMGIAVMMLIATGIMYILASTSDKKAELKKHVPNYLLGAILTFSASILLKLVAEFITKNINE